MSEPTPRDDAAAAGPPPRHPVIATLALLVALGVGSLGAGLAACGFGSYDDRGAAEPGSWWPWVCLATDGGAVPDGGCPPLPCLDAGAGRCAADGGGDGPDEDAPTGDAGP